MDFRAKNNLLNKTHMKKYFVLAMIAIMSLNSHATPKEFWKERPCIARKQCDLDAYIGSQKYKYLVGGLYRKGNTLGAVLYIDEEKGTMMLYTVTQHKAVPQFGDEATYENIKAAYQRNGWHMFDKETMYYFCKNQHTMLYQRNWEDTEDYELYIPYFLPLESDEYTYNINIYDTVHRNCDVTVNTRLYYITNDKGEPEAVHCCFAHGGWFEVPLEPQYVSDYITE